MMVDITNFVDVDPAEVHVTELVYYPVLKQLMDENEDIDDLKEAIRKKFTGVVVSDKMAKTIVVKVEAVKIHPKYHKRYVISRKYKVHDEKDTYKTGDTVTFIGCRPFSKDKKWRVVTE